MKILFYYPAQRYAFISSGVHMAEVFNYLISHGHVILYANGKQHDFYDPLTADTEITEQPGRKTIIFKVKQYLLHSPFRGGITLLYDFFKEMLCFVSAFRTSLRQKPELIYRRWGYPNIFGSEYLLAKLFKLSVIEEVHGIAANEIKISKRLDKCTIKAIDLLERRNIKKADKYIVVTSTLKDVLHNDYGIPEDKIIVIENGANVDLFKPMDTVQAKNAIELDKNTSYICYSGNFARYQGIEYLIRVIPEITRQLPNVKAILVGDGEMRDELQELVEELDISEKVIFIGKVPYSKVPLYINAGDVCVVPKKPLLSGYSPLKLYEYMACGKPIVATRTYGFEILKERKAGLLVNPEDSEEFSKALIKLLKDNKLRTLMGNNGRQYVVENHSWESISQKVAQVCHDTLKEYNDLR